MGGLLSKTTHPFLINPHKKKKKSVTNKEKSTCIKVLQRFKKVNSNLSSIANNNQFHTSVQGKANRFLRTMKKLSIPTIGYSNLASRKSPPVKEFSKSIYRCQFKSECSSLKFLK